MVTEIYVNLTENLSDDEWKSIAHFMRRVEKLKNTEYYREHYKIDAKMEFNLNGNQNSCNLPPETVIAQYLLAYRHFWAKKERSYFLRILKIFGRYASTNLARQKLKELRTSWENSLFNSAIEISINDEKLTSHKLIDAWFNGEYFHSNEDHIKTLKSMDEIFSNDFSKFMLIDSITNGSNIIFKISDALDGIKIPENALNQS